MNCVVAALRLTEGHTILHMHNIRDFFGFKNDYLCPQQIMMAKGDFGIKTT